MNRYFIVFYIIGNSSSLVHGNISFYTDDGTFAKQAEVVDEITKSYPQNARKHKDIVITNIIELSEEDYNTWIT
jgi:hypothetical protein